MPRSLLTAILLTLAAGIIAWLTWTTFFQPPPPLLAGSPHPPAQVAGPISPLPVQSVADPAKVELGRRLFHETRLSRDDSISCADCHDLERGGSDGLARSRGIDGRTGLFNTPSVYNSALNFTQFWDGRARTLEDAIDATLRDPAQLDSDLERAVAKLHGDAAYRKAFGLLYPDGMTPANVRQALAEFLRSLVTPSRFDRYLLGDPDALGTEEMAGFELFKRYGCASCHQGTNVGGNMYEKIGIMGDYFEDRGTPAEEGDLGRYRVTGREDHKYEFKVPSLRNVALTAPYFHDGGILSLEQAIILMGRYQLGQDIPADDVLRIARFLRSLTGERLPSRGAGSTQ